MVRIIDASPDAPLIDVYRGSTALTYNLAFANITSYIPAVPGTDDLSISVSGSRQTLAALHDPLKPSLQYTLLVAGNEATLHPILLADQSTPAPPGQASLRFLNQSNARTPFDLFLLSTGASAANSTPILTGQTFGANSGYLNLPAGSYRILLYQAGADLSATLPVYSGATITYPAGAARTIVLIDQKSTLQCITAADFDPQPN